MLDPYLLTRNSDFCLTEMTIVIYRCTTENRKGNRLLAMANLKKEISGRPVTSLFCTLQIPQ
jgi:hypothetical protein